MMRFERRLHMLLLGLRSLFRGADADRELDEELRYHLERQIDEHIARGLTPARARREALIAMGGLDQRKEECRDMRKTRVIEDFFRDLRYAARTLQRNPGFAAVVILSLALGIGANTAMFSAIDAVMLRLLPVNDPKQLVMLTWTHDGFPKEFVQSIEGMHGLTFPFVAYEAVRDHNDVFDGTFAFAGNTPPVNVGLRGRADWAGVKGVSGNYFDALGVTALYGRMLRPDDDREAAAPVAVVSYRFWSGTLAHDPASVGTPMVVNGVPVTIVGVTPPEFFGLDPATAIDLFIPLHEFAAQLVAAGNAGDVPFTRDPQTWWIHIGGRLKPGVSAAEADSRVNLLFERSLRAAGGPQAQTARTPRIATAPAGRGLDRLRTRYATSLLLLMGMVGLVLLIASANAAGLARAIRATRVDVRPIVKLTSRKLLVSAQVAACLLLLMCAGLLQRTLQKLEGVDLGFDRQQLVLFIVRPGLNGYKDARLVGYYDELQRRLNAIPSVRSSTLSLRPAVGGGSGSSGATIAGVTKPDERPTIFRHQIGPGYFGTLGIPIMAGRSIGPQDGRSAPHVAVINQALAQKYFRRVNPIGHRIDFGNAARPNAFEIVGVAQDAKYNPLRTEAPPAAYMPYQQFLALPNV